MFQYQRMTNLGGNFGYKPSRVGRGKAQPAPLRGACFAPARGHCSGRGGLPFQRGGTAGRVVHRCTSLRGIASPAASPRPQQSPCVSLRAALPRPRSPRTSTTARPYHLRSPRTSATHAPRRGSGWAEGGLFHVERFSGNGCSCNGCTCNYPCRHRHSLQPCNCIAPSPRRGLRYVRHL